MLERLLHKLQQSGIRLSNDGGTLQIKAPKGAMTKAFLEEIKQHKQELLELLSATESVIPVHQNIDAPFPISSQQKRFWVLSQFKGGNKAYAIPEILMLEGKIDVEKLNEAFLYCIKRHESLRTYFVENEGEIMQSIVPEASVNFSIKVKDNVDEEKEISQFFEEEFDLTKAPLVNVSLLKKTPSEAILCFAMHHIIGDGWSTEIIIKEVMHIYNTLLSNEKPVLPKLRIQYKDYVLWKLSEKEQKRIAQQQEFWMQLFSDEITKLKLPFQKQRPAVKEYKGEVIQHTFSNEFITTLHAFTKKEKVTVFMTLMSGIKAVCYRYSGTSDITLGVPVALREHSELAHQVGLYLNTLAIRTQIEKKMSFSAFAKLEKETLVSCYKNQEYPFDELIEKLNLARDASSTPVFDILVTLQSQQKLKDFQKNSIEGLSIKEYDKVTRKVSQLDLSFSFIEKENTLSLYLEYDTSLYEASAIQNFVQHLENFLVSAMKNPEQQIDAINMISEVEEKQLYQFTETTKKYPQKGIISIFKTQVAEKPNAIAVCSEQGKFTYQQLDKDSDSLASSLKNTYQIQSKEYVGVQLERGYDLMVSVLAILKIGAVYMPIALKSPKQRTQSIIANSNCKLLIDKEVIVSCKNEQAEIQYQPAYTDASKHPMYLIHTSGTTGTPKGVLISQGSLLNLCYWHQNAYKVNRNSRGTLYSSIAFDASIWEIFPYLLNGACVYPIADDTVRLDSGNLIDFLKKNDITHAYLPTTIITELVNQEISLNKTKVLTGGEALVINKAPKFELYNNYGPTENTVVATYAQITKENWQNITIGKPIDNVKTYVLSDALQLQPIGAIGELYISGKGLAEMYINDPKTTQEKFIQSPFHKEDKIYKTGDLIAWNAQGNIEFIGRKDTQIQLRGHRIEVEEINTALLKHHYIHNAVVKKTIVQKDAMLVAYIVGHEEIDIEAVRKELSTFLPMYMIPDLFIKVPQIPLNASGKVAWNALPTVDQNSLPNKDYQPPRNEKEEKLVHIWQEVLGIPKIGIYDDFFALGGHSLKAMQIVSKINAVFMTVITLNDLFENTKIATLQQVIQEQNEAFSAPDIIEGSTQISSSQKRIWLQQQLQTQNSYYIPAVFKINQKIDKKRLGKSFKTLLQQYPMLRTAYVEKEGEISPRLLAVNDWKLKIIKPEIELTEKRMQQIFSIPFHIEKEYPFRAFLQEISEEEYILILTIHHIAVDGWAIQLIFNLLLAEYESSKEEKYPQKVTSYENFITDENQKKAYWSQYANYWKAKLQDASYLVLNDTTSPAFEKKTQATNALEFSLTAELKHQLQDFSNAHETTLFMVLLSVFKTVLYHSSNQTDICIGTPISLRDQLEYESVVGCFLNVLPLRTNCDPEQSFLAFLKQVKETVLGGFSNKDLPFEEIVKVVNPDRSHGKHPFFQVMFNMVTLPESTYEAMDMPVEIVHGNWDKSKYDITLYVNARETLDLEIVYNATLFSASYIEKIKTDFIEVANKIITRPNTPLKTCIVQPEQTFVSKDDLWKQMLD